MNKREIINALKLLEDESADLAEEIRKTEKRIFSLL